MQQWTERPAADGQVVALAQKRADIEGVLGEHRVALQHQLTIQVDLRDGGDAVESKNHLLSYLERLGFETRAKPPILGIEVKMVPRLPQAGVLHHAGGRARYSRRSPALQSVESRRIHAEIGRGRDGLPSVSQRNQLMSVEQWLSL